MPSFCDRASLNFRSWVSDRHLSAPSRTTDLLSLVSNQESSIP
jgi:hypothetical protein